MAAPKLEPTVTIGGAPAGYSPVTTLQPTVTIGGAPAGYTATATPNYITGAGVPGVQVSAPTPTPEPTPTPVKTGGVVTKTVVSVVPNSNGTRTIYYSDGTTAIEGVPVVTKTVVSVVPNSNGTRTIYYSDGTTAIEGVPVTQPVVVPTDTGVKQSAKDIVNGYLREAGLGALTDATWSQWNSGTTADQIMDWVRQQPDYAARFPAMATLRSAGRSITESQYIAKEQADIELMTSYGIPTDMATNRQLLGKLIANNVNVVDLQKRLIAAQDSILSKDKSVLTYAKDTFGLDTGDLMAFALNPEIATPIIEQKAKAIQIGGAAFQASQALGAAQAMQLAAGGVSAEQAKQGFLNTAQQQQLTQNLPGDVSGSVTQEELVNAQFGMSPEAIAKAKKVSGTRAAEFQGGGQYLSTQTGISGIGAAPQV